MTHEAEIREGLQIAIKQVETIQAALTAPATTNDGLKAAAETLRQRLRATLLTLKAEEPLEAPLAVVEGWLLNGNIPSKKLTGLEVHGVWVYGGFYGKVPVTITITKR